MKLDWLISGRVKVKKICGGAGGGGGSLIFTSYSNQVSFMFLLSQIHYMATTIRD